MDKIPEHVVQSLIEIGRECSRDQQPDAATMLAVQEYGWVNVADPRSWNEANAGLDADELAHLAIGLSHVENTYGWIGGSVSAVIWILDRVHKRDPNTWIATSTWIHARTANGLVGRYRPTFGAHSYAEYLTKRAAHEAAKKERQARHHAQEARAQDAKLQAERKRAAQRASSVQDRDSQKRSDFLVALAELPIEKQLRQLADDKIYSVEFYPTSLAGGAQDEILSSLDEATKSALREKLKGPRRGPWASFKRRLGSAS